MREKHCQLEEFIKNVLRELLISFGLYIVSELELTRRCNGFLSLFAFFEMTSFISSPRFFRVFNVFFKITFIIIFLALTR